MTDKSLADLDPTLQPLAQKWLDNYQALGRKATITETFRSPAREDLLHAEGITRATSLTCDHCAMIDGNPASRAFDFALFGANGDYIADGSHPWYAEAGQIAKDLGLVYGGDFTHPDPDHIQLKD